MLSLALNNFAGRRNFLPVLGRIVLLCAAMACSAAVDANIRVEAYAGQPLGVGRVVIDLPPETAEVALADDRFGVDDATGRVLYPAPKPERARKVLRKLLGVQLPRKLTYYFLIQGDEPLTLDVYLPDRIQVNVTPQVDGRKYAELFDEWWESYVGLYERVHRQAEYPVGVQTYLTAMWAGRLGQEMPRLEGFLLREREQGGTTTGKLMADEAYRASVLRDLMLGELDDSAADEPLPAARIPVAGAALPTGEVAVEPIAAYVPEECFYVRFGTFNNYLWFREFLGRWKGDLGNMLVLRSIRRSTSDQISSILGLKESKLSAILGPQVINDVAIIGTDPYFRDGASVGVLFQAKNNFLLSTSFSQQRSAVVGEVSGAKNEKVDVAGHQVSYLSSPDGSLRSYYASEGDYHLVTSSRTIVERFFEAAAGDRALAAAPDFLAARRTRPVTQDDRVFVHLSQAFLANLTSPAYRIELDRRLRSIEAHQAMELARLAAKQEGLSGDTESDLVDGSFLPQGFTTRADGAVWQTGDGTEWYESIRGYPGRMLPIADNLPTTCSAAERRRYERFAYEVTSEVGSLVPVTAWVHSTELAPGLERISVDVYLQCYSSTNLASWAKKLGPASPVRLAPIGGDIVSAEVVLDGLLGGGEPFHVFAGLRDGHVPLVVQGGGLRTVTSITNAVEGYVGAWPRPQFLQTLLGRPRGPYDADGFARTSGLFDLWCRRADDFLLFSFKRHVLAEVGSQLAMVEAERPAQAWITLHDLAGTQYEQVATALAYSRSRATSVSGSRFMNSLIEQLHVDKPAAKDLASQLAAGEFVCPLGGEYLLVEVPGGIQAWASTAAAPNNQFLLTEIPANYKFPLLDWFRGMTAELFRGDDSLTLSLVVDISGEGLQGGVAVPTPR